MHHKSYLQGNGNYIKLNESFYPIFEMESIAQCTSKVSNYRLVYIEENFLDLKEEFSSWFEEICLKNIYFKKFKFMLKILFLFFVEDFSNFENTHLTSKKDYLI